MRTSIPTLMMLAVSAFVTVHAADPAPVKAILVTGASSGIGRSVTEHLAAAGQLVQLNEGHAYTYDRDALVKMLDEALATARPRKP